MQHFKATQVAPWTGELNPNMGDEWQAVVNDLVAFAKEWEFNYTINTHEDGSGDGITVYMRDDMWQADAFAQYIAILGKIPQWPDGQLWFTSWAQPNEILFTFWHD